jgi:YHS domain-containing protein
LEKNDEILVSQDMCILCGRPIEGIPIIEKIDGKRYVFGREKCALTFKKLESVYGSDFCANFTT